MEGIYVWAFLVIFSSLIVLLFLTYYFPSDSVFLFNLFKYVYHRFTSQTTWFSSSEGIMLGYLFNSRVWLTYMATSFYFTPAPLRDATNVHIWIPSHHFLFSTHAPLAGVQLVTPPNASVSIEFQPIHPIRDATISMQAATIQYNISPLHPCVVQL